MFANLDFGVATSQTGFAKKTTSLTSSVHLDLNLVVFFTSAIYSKIGFFFFSLLIMVLIAHIPPSPRMSVRLAIKLCSKKSEGGDTPSLLAAS